VPFAPASPGSGAMIRQWRKRAGLNQCELAREIGVTPVAVTLMETRDNTPRRPTLARLIRALRLTHDEAVRLVVACALGVDDLLPVLSPAPLAGTAHAA